VQRLISFRFLKFCTVGLSGVVVNLTLLAVLADGFGMQVNLASALTIEASINSNFFINELWTFRDRRSSSAGFLRRLLKFHLVSIMGGLIQWGVFIALNAVWLTVLDRHADMDESAASQGLVQHYIIDPVINPQDVGNLKYLSQLGGIAVATFWNYVANFHWTWGSRERESNHD
jgi:putative flippase GtrA